MDETLEEFVADTRPIVDLIGLRLGAIEDGTGDLSGLDEARRLLNAIDSRAEPLDLLRLRHLLGRMSTLAGELGADPAAPDPPKLRALRAALDRLRWQVSVLARLGREAPGDDEDLVAAERRAVSRPQPGVPGRSSTPGVLLEEEVERLRAQIGPDMVPVSRAHLVELARLARDAATARERMALPADPDTADFQSALDALCRTAFLLEDKVRDRAKTAEPARDTSRDRPARRVLLVDDQAFFRTLLARALTRAGCHVTTATTAREAYALASAGADLDAIITDLDLPETDGFGLARALLAHPRRRDMPILGLAPHASADLFVRARAAGIRRVVGKFDREALLEWLANEVPARGLASDAA